MEHNLDPKRYVWKADGEESPDVVRAYMWYEVSAKEGNTEARKELVSLEKEMTPQQLADARAKAQKCASSKYELCD